MIRVLYEFHGTARRLGRSRVMAEVRTRSRSSDPLARYRAKRDFKLTPEPQGGRATATRNSFVVQKHAARRLHYDFRLELDGTLKSWAVTRGPSLDPSDKRLAVHVEDHPIDYAGFEGIIPSGEYGGGTVMVWDRGTWEPIGDPRQGYKSGKLQFALHGKKLKGRWTLVRMRSRARYGRGDNWLLIKERDEEARPGRGNEALQQQTKSALTGRSMEQIARAPAKSARAKLMKTRKRDTMPDFVLPQISTSVDRPRKESARLHKIGLNDNRNHPDMVAGVALTHPNRVLYAEQGLTKRDLAEYYITVADAMLAHVAGRPLTLVRCPVGEGKSCFYQKHPGSSAPAVLRRIKIAEGSGTHEYAVVDDVASLVALAQMGVLEIHPWGSRIEHLEQPDRIVFDFDPAPDVSWERVVAAAAEMRERLKALGLESFLKTTGGKGLHVIAPINPCEEWPAVKAFTKAVATAMKRDAPDQYTTAMSKHERRGRIFIDYLRNDRGSTAIAPYSTRARPGAPVATPLAWRELKPGLAPSTFNVLTIPERLRSLKADPWAEFSKLDQGITAKAKMAVGLR